MGRRSARGRLPASDTFRAPSRASLLPSRPAPFRITPSATACFTRNSEMAMLPPSMATSSPSCSIGRARSAWSIISCNGREAPSLLRDSRDIERLRSDGFELVSVRGLLCYTRMRTAATAYLFQMCRECLPPGIASMRRSIRRPTCWNLPRRIGAILTAQAHSPHPELSTSCAAIRNSVKMPQTP